MRAEQGSRVTASTASCPHDTPALPGSDWALPGTSGRWSFPPLPKKRQRILAGTARPAI